MYSKIPPKAIASSYFYHAIFLSTLAFSVRTARIRDLVRMIIVINELNPSDGTNLEIINRCIYMCIYA